MTGCHVFAPVKRSTMHLARHPTCRTNSGLICSGLSTALPSLTTWHHHTCSRPLPRPGASARTKPTTRQQSHRHTTTATAAATASGSTIVWERLAAEVVGYMVIAGSLVRSLPQIIRCLQARSVDGLSMTSILCETFVYFITTAYNWRAGYTFSTYGDVVSCLVQDIFLIGMLFYFGKYTKRAMVAISAATAVFGWWCLSGVAGMHVLTQMQAATVVLLAVGGRMPQIALNWQRGNSGELSFITCVLNVMGCAARVFTTLMLTGDKIILWGTGSQFFLNAILLYQVVDTARQQQRGPFAPGGGQSQHAVPKPTS